MGDTLYFFSSTGFIGRLWNLSHHIYFTNNFIMLWPCSFLYFWTMTELVPFTLECIPSKSLLHSYLSFGPLESVIRWIMDGFYLYHFNLCVRADRRCSLYIFTVDRTTHELHACVDHQSSCSTDRVPSQSHHLLLGQLRRCRQPCSSFAKCGSLPTDLNLNYLPACNMSSTLYFAPRTKESSIKRLSDLQQMSTTLFPNSWDRIQLGSSPFNQIKCTLSPQTHAHSPIYNLDENDQFISVQLCLQADSSHHNVLGLLDSWGFAQGQSATCYVGNSLCVYSCSYQFTESFH